MRKFLIILMIALVPFSAFAASDSKSVNTDVVASKTTTVVKPEAKNKEQINPIAPDTDVIEKGFDIDMYALGHFIRTTDIAVGAGINLGYRYGGVQYDFYTNFEYFLNPGGGPQALSMEMLLEPGLRFEFEFLKRKITSTSFVLDLGYMMTWGKNTAYDDKIHMMANGVTIRPGVSFNFDFGAYETAIGIFYNAVIYPRGLSSEYDGIVLAIKFF